MITRKSQSSEYPLIVDEFSSPTTVYVRENIREISKQDEYGNMLTLYEYDEKVYERWEWLTLMANTSRDETEQALIEIDMLRAEQINDIELALIELAERI